MDKIDCMRAFKQVVDSGGYAAAARDMGMTRSTVNKYVSHLEHELNTQLLVSSTRKVRPTETGLAFYDKCVVLIGDYDEAIATISQLQAQPQGRLRINAPMSFGTMHLSKIVADFMQLHPAVHIELSLADRMVDPIEEGFDISIRISEPRTLTSLISKELAQTQRILCASPDYLATTGKLQHPRELVQHRCLHYGYNQSGSHWQLTGPDGDMNVPITCAMWSNNGEVLRDAAIADGGITLLPTFVACDALRTGQLVEVLGDFKPPNSILFALYPRHRHLSSKVQLFVNFVEERLDDRDGWLECERSGG